MPGDQVLGVRQAAGAVAVVNDLQAEAATLLKKSVVPPLTVSSAATAYMVSSLCSRVGVICTLTVPEGACTVWAGPLPSTYW